MRRMTEKGHRRMAQAYLAQAKKPKLQNSEFYPKLGKQEPDLMGQIQKIKKNRHFCQKNSDMWLKVSLVYGIKGNCTLMHAGTSKTHVCIPH